jgi:phenylacetate-coenzyme A ligase PaaK-like adenylate-forming protein
MNDPARRADAMLKWSVAAVPFYAAYPSRLAQAPFIDARTVRLHWDEFTRRGGEGLLGDPRRADQRFSSGSSGGPKLRTVVEREVAMVRRAYENIVAGDAADAAAKFFLGRPENLDLIWRGGVATKRGVRWVAVTPGPDPTAVSDDDWDRVGELLVREDPTCIEADPAYLCGLARRCLVRRIALPRLTRIVVGQSYCWSVYAEPIEKAFGLPVRSCLATSEFGVLGLACDEGRLHLLENGFFFEIVTNGRRAREGEVGALAVTTLDTRLRPLLRYLNGDLVRYVSPECRCGRPHRIIEYEGRIANALEGRDGRLVTCRDLDLLIGAPAGVRYFRLRESNVECVLELLASSRESVTVTTLRSLRSSLEETLVRPVAIRFVESFGLRTKGKHIALETTDRSVLLLRRFLDHHSRAGGSSPGVADPAPSVGSSRRTPHDGARSPR